MKRAEEVNRKKVLQKIIENCNVLLNNKNFLSNNNWETDTFLLQAESNLKRKITEYSKSS
tara:strand:- start:335 stop:514 length:180 start_codon:yes stop_codon:yes gene_type:complete